MITQFIQIADLPSVIKKIQADRLFAELLDGNWEQVRLMIASWLGDTFDEILDGLPHDSKSSQILFELAKTFKDIALGYIFERSDYGSEQLVKQILVLIDKLPGTIPNFSVAAGLGGSAFLLNEFKRSNFNSKPIIALNITDQIQFRLRMSKKSNWCYWYIAENNGIGSLVALLNAKSTEEKNYLIDFRASTVSSLILIEDEINL